MKELVGELNRKLHEHLINHKWNYFGSNELRHGMYTKCKKKEDLEDVCAFLSYGHKARYTPPKKVADMVSEFLERYGWIKQRPVPILNTKGKTMFIGAGIQCLEETLYKERDLHFGGPRIIIQPSIRTHAQTKVKEKDGFSTSFISLGSEHINPTVEEYIGEVEIWFDVLSYLGINVNDMVLKSNVDWEGGPMLGKSLLMYLGGLQLGDAVFIYNVPQRTRPHLRIADIGFGLERICWATSKLPSYWDVFSPHYSFDQPREQRDILRTTTLMIAGSVFPSNRGVNYIPRKFVKTYIQEKGSLDIERQIRYYHKYWNQFLELPVNEESTVKVLFEELDRCHNIALLDKLGIKNKGESINKTSEEFIRMLLEESHSINNI